MRSELKALLAPSKSPLYYPNGIPVVFPRLTHGDKEFHAFCIAAPSKYIFKGRSLADEVLAAKFPLENHIEELSIACSSGVKSNELRDDSQVLGMVARSRAAFLFVGCVDDFQCNALVDQLVIALGRAKLEVGD